MKRLVILWGKGCCFVSKVYDKRRILELGNCIDKLYLVLFSFEEYAPRESHDAFSHAAQNNEHLENG